MRTTRPSEETATESPENARLETAVNSNPLAMEVKAAFDVEKVIFGINLIKIQLFIILSFYYRMKI